VRCDQFGNLNRVENIELSRADERPQNQGPGPGVRDLGLGNSD
jgi:hypothetical protein